MDRQRNPAAIYCRTANNLPESLALRPHRYQHLPVATGLHRQAIMFDAVTANLSRYMDLLSARQKLVTSNIANADTPGYRTQDIDFQFEFMSLAKGLDPQTIKPRGLTEKPDGNNVNMDREARLLSEDSIRFNLASTLVRGKLKQVRDAIDEGKNG